MFEKKSQEEIDKMTPKEYEAYLVAKESHDAEVRKEEITKAIEEAQKNNASVEQIKELTEKQAVIIKELEAFGLRMKALSEKPMNDSSKSTKTLEQSIKAATEENEAFKSVANGGKQSAPITFEVKAAVTMGLDTTVEAVGSESQISITRNSGIVSTIRKRILKYLSGGVSVGSLAGQNKVMWIEELDEQGAPIFIGEGDTKTQLSVRYEERDKKARKIGVHGKVTTEMMRNLPSLINYIKNNLMRRVDIKTEDQLFAGNDTGDNLAGLTEYAVPFTGGSLAGTLPTGTASDADVFRAIALQIVEAYGIASAVYVRPSVVAAMDVAKSADGIYLLPPFRAANGNIVAGMTLIESNGLPSGVDFIGGDLSVVNVLFSDNMSVQIGVDGNDFINNKKTILVEQELVQFVSANDVNVLVQGDMATAKTALEV
jgi:hypothetical protein